MNGLLRDPSDGQRLSLAVTLALGTGGLFDAPEVVYLTTMSSSRKKHSPFNSAPAIGPASHSQPVYTWSAHSPLGQSPFPRCYHTLSTTPTATGELFLFGGYAHDYSNDLYMFSTRDFSITLLRTSGETPSPRVEHGAALTDTLLSVWGGWTNVQSQRYDDSLYLLNLGMSDLLMSRSAPADQSFFHSSIARVDPRCDQWSQALRSLQPYRDFGWFQTLCFRWPDR